MIKSLNSYNKQLKKVLYNFDAAGSKVKIRLLKQISKTKLVASQILIDYYHSLLFLSAYPHDAAVLEHTKKELQRISNGLRQMQLQKKHALENSGLPYSPYMSCFTHEFLQWLFTVRGLNIKLGSIENTKHNLNEVLKHTLPALEKSETTAGCTNDQLFDVLKIQKGKELHFLLSELNNLNDTPFIKDHFYEGLGVYTEIVPTTKSASIAYNRFSLKPVFVSDELIKNFDHFKLINSKISNNVKLSVQKREELISVIKMSMAVTDRETDTVTYMDDHSLRYYELERGIAVAIYTMTPERQLPLESYVGFTLFKNGFPTAYGGAWVFGARANFGINIFEPFRGGESGYILCQMIRLYKHVFNINYFLIEPYQFGYDNPEGIESGAFWFYYKYGFRPVNKNIFNLAKTEAAKKVKNRSYRTGKNKLIQFTESDIALNFKDEVPLSVNEIIVKVRSMITKKYKGNRTEAVRKCADRFMRISAMKTPSNPNELKVLQDLALWSAAFSINDKDKLQQMGRFIKLKNTDLYKYQKIISAFLCKD